MILAPAGNQAAFLAAIAAGTDAVYCGLKEFSARMAAKNFDLAAMIRLIHMAHDRGVQVHLALNTLIKPSELTRVTALLDHLNQCGSPDAIIFQDPAVIEIAHRIGFQGALHLSTLANVSFPRALGGITKRLPVNCVVLPRELSIDEIRAMAQTCPKGLGLEVFVHGALCYAVSGRCYWSSWLGGKSGLRGRCVQPCRRRYKSPTRQGRLFSCQDLHLDVLTKVLKSIPQIQAWKIEGRKKGPHYVYYTVRAYRLIRDHGKDPAAKKEAMALLDRSLGRTGTHYHFLPQRSWNPIDASQRTGSGMYIGSVKGPIHSPYINPREPLLPNDVLRVGYEDDRWHQVIRVQRNIPAKGKLVFKTKAKIPKHTPVFLTDRREPFLLDNIAQLEKELESKSVPTIANRTKALVLPKGKQTRQRPMEVQVLRKPIRGKSKYRNTGYWLSDNVLKSLPSSAIGRVWWWLPPVIWPDKPAQNEQQTLQLIRKCQEKGGKHFVVNATWQWPLINNETAHSVWAGPFCNLANPLALKIARDLGYSGTIISPELSREDVLSLPQHSPMPLGIVISGNWPLCISRIHPPDLEPEKTFISPMNETAWTTIHDGNTWIFPNWKLDLTQFQSQLQQAGYHLFVHLHEPVPSGIELKKRPGQWNWNIGLA